MTIKFRSKTIRREFQLDLGELGPFAPAVMEVLQTVQKDTIGVYRPDDEEAFRTRFDEGGHQVLHEAANLNVSIPEWLCAACQSIRWESEEDAAWEGRTSTTLAWYSHNTNGTLFAVNSRLGTGTLRKPVGPAGFQGEIVLTFGMQQWLCSGNEKDRDKFRFVVAHELVHVFEGMRVIVPAFIDWDTYWERALRGGLQADAPAEIAQRSSKCLDQYGGLSELAMIEEYWPSETKRWCEAFRGPSRKRPAARKRE